MSTHNTHDKSKAELEGDSTQAADKKVISERASTDPITVGATLTDGGGHNDPPDVDG